MASLTPPQLVEHIRQALRSRGANGEFYLDLPDVPDHQTYGSLGGHPVDYIFIRPDGYMRLFDQADQGHDIADQSPELLQKILDNIQLTTSPNGHSLI